MRVFISQMMNGLSEDEILQTRRAAEDHLKNAFGDVDIIESYIDKNIPKDAGRLWYLGASIQLMQDADIVCFCPGWNKAAGCQVEYAVCQNYGIPILEM